MIKSELSKKPHITYRLLFVAVILVITAVAMAEEPQPRWASEEVSAWILTLPSDDKPLQLDDCLKDGVNIQCLQIYWFGIDLTHLKSGETNER